MYYSSGSQIQGEIKIWRPYNTSIPPTWDTKSTSARGAANGGLTSGCVNICQTLGHYTETGGIKNPTGFKLTTGAALDWANWHLYGLT